MRVTVSQPPWCACKDHCRHETMRRCRHIVGSGSEAEGDGDGVVDGPKGPPTEGDGYHAGGGLKNDLSRTFTGHEAGC